MRHLKKVEIKVLNDLLPIALVTDKSFVEKGRQCIMFKLDKILNTLNIP